MTLEEMEKRVQVLEDIEEIKKLHRKYVHLVSLRQHDKLLDLYTEDATVNIWKYGPRKGKKAIAEMVKDPSDPNMVMADHSYLLAHPVINVDGNTAKGTWALYLFWSEPEVKWVQGRQECEYEKINGEWKIKSNKYIRPWPVGPDTFPKD